MLNPYDDAGFATMLLYDDVDGLATHTDMLFMLGYESG